MESEGCVYIIYDKYGNNSHAFDDKTTEHLTIEHIFSNEKYTFVENKEAIETFNKMFNDKIDLNLDGDIYKLFFFDCESVFVTILIVNINKLEQYFEINKTIPNKDFLIKACTFDKLYRDNNFHITDIENVTTKIVDQLNIPNKSELELAQPEFLKMSLFPYQKRTIHWLINQEKNIDLKKSIIRTNKNSEYEIKIGNIIINPIEKTISTINTIRDNINFNGGALIDEVGLGKTVQMLTMSLLNKSKNISMIKDNCINSNATLIVCPNQLCGQWNREIHKMIKDSKKLNIILLLTKVHFDKTTYYELINADFVIVSYNFLLNDAFLKEWLIKFGYKKTYLGLDTCDTKIILNHLQDFNKTLLEDANNLFGTKPVLPIINWHRIMIDEFHELYTRNSIYNILSLFKAKYKWCITGTPFNNPDGLISTLRYITNNNTMMQPELFRNQDIRNYILDNIFIRNTKASIEYKFPLLTQRIIWLRFTGTERMIYNAYLTDTSISKVLLRQLCCHPQIADEIKGVLTNCKTLKDIENTMVSHYKTNATKSKIIVDFYENKIKKIQRKIKIVMFKKQRKFLRQLGYKVKIVYPPKITNIQLIDVQTDDDDIALSDNDELSSESSDDNLNKELIIVDEDNQTKIYSLVGDQLKNDQQTKSIDKLKDHQNTVSLKLAEANKDYSNKVNTLDFYNNMLERLKKCTAVQKEDGFDDVCGICLGNIGDEQIGVTKCGHIFCYDCLKLTISQKHMCPICMKSTNINEIYVISYEKQVVNTECIKNKLELINNVGTKLANLIFYLKSIEDHVVIFSHWGELLKKIGIVLSSHGIKNVFCRGNVWQRDKIIRDFNDDPSIRIIMLSSESAASGTNLTKASKVIFIEPIDGTAEYIQQTEWQAIGRVYRLGQTKTVEILRFIVKDTIEEEIYKTNIVNKVIPLNISETFDSTIDLSTDAIRDINKNIYKSKKQNK
jgi:SNF2 family DNA or RNA helicase